MRALLSLCLLLLAAIGLAAPASAQSTGALAPAPLAFPRPDRPLIVAVRAAPPFVVKQPDGQWTGLAIQLWRGIAQDLGVSYRFQEASLPDMIQGVADGRYDLSVGAITITPGREAKIDFTQPFYTTGFGIVTDRAPPGWLVLLRNFFTWQFLQVVLMLGGLLLIVGFFFWLAEHRRNDQFGGGKARGIADGFWFSAVTMTTVGYGDKAPRTLAGRLIAVVWMFAAVIIISTFTGMIASSLTESRLGGSIRNTDDLRTAKVGSIDGTAAQSYLDQTGIGFTSYPDLASGLNAVRDNKIDAFVYDRPLLRYLVHTRYSDQLRLIPGTFGQQTYGFGLPQHSPMREAIDQALLRRTQSQGWQTLVSDTLGGPANE